MFCNNRPAGDPLMSVNITHLVHVMDINQRQCQFLTFTMFEIFKQFSLLFLLINNFIWLKDLLLTKLYHRLCTNSFFLNLNKKSATGTLTFTVY